MSFSSQPRGDEANDIVVSFTHVTKFVRQISHDVRNNLGSMDLQAAYAMELITDAEVIGELRKLRGMITSTAKMLQNISRSFQVPKPERVTLSAQVLFEDFRERFTKLHAEEAARFEWQMEIADEAVAVDIELIFGALLECCRNAVHFHDGHGKLHGHVHSRDGALLMELQQHREKLDVPLAEWGVKPLLSTRRAGYGLGLFHARQVFAAHNGGVEFIHDVATSNVITRVNLPLAGTSTDAR